MLKSNKKESFFKQSKEKMEDLAVHISILFFTIAVLILVFWSSVVITIQSGEGGVLYKRFFGGTVLDKVYGEGLHLIFPWDTMTIYNVRVQQKKHEVEVLAKGGLRVHIDLSMRYKPDYDVLAVLHASVGPDYIDKIVIPEIEATMRAAVGQFTPEELYSSKQAEMQEIVNEAIERTNRKYIVVDDVMITKIVLPEQIQDAIQDKLTLEQQAQAKIYEIQKQELEAKRMQIEAEAIKLYHTTISSSLTKEVLKFKGIQATEEISKSQNSKVVIMGSGENQLPVILNTESK